MKNFIKLLFIFVVSAWFVYIVVLKSKQIQRVSICHEQVHELVYKYNKDTICVPVCQYSSKVINLVSEDISFYYCEHLSDTTHVKRIIPINSENYIKILKYK